jgi:hypothetical protein
VLFTPQQILPIQNFVLGCGSRRICRPGFPNVAGRRRGLEHQFSGRAGLHRRRGRRSAPRRSEREQSQSHERQPVQIALFWQAHWSQLIC